MAKFKFSLRNYLDLKEKIAEQKKMEYGRALNKLEQEKQKKERMVEERNAEINHFREDIMQGVKPASIRMHNDYIGALKHRIKEQEVVVKGAQRHTEGKRLELVKAVQDRKMLEALKDKAYTEYIREEKLAEQKVVDEIVSYKYNNRTE